MADLASGIAISLSFHQYSYHGNYMVHGTLRHWLAVIIIANRNKAGAFHYAKDSRNFGRNSNGEVRFGFF